MLPLLFAALSLALPSSILCAFFPSPDFPVTHFARLDGYSEVPPLSGGSSAYGLALIHVTGSSVYCIQYDSMISRSTGAHIHGPADEASTGPVLLTLPVPGAVPVNFTKVDNATTSAILTGRAYVNVHTSSYPNGEIRGQIKPVGAPGRSAAAYFRPGNSPIGAGSAPMGAVVTSFDPATGRLSYTIFETITATITSVIIGTGAEGTVGDIVQTLIPASQLQAGPTMWTGTSAPLTASAILDLQQGKLYIGLTTATGTAATGDFKAYLKVEQPLGGGGGGGNTVITRDPKPLPNKAAIGAAVFGWLAAIGVIAAIVFFVTRTPKEAPRITSAVGNPDSAPRTGPRANHAPAPAPAEAAQVTAKPVAPPKPANLDL